MVDQDGFQFVFRGESDVLHREDVLAPRSSFGALLFEFLENVLLLKKPSLVGIRLQLSLTDCTFFTIQQTLPDPGLRSFHTFEWFEPFSPDAGNGRFHHDLALQIWIRVPKTGK